MFHEVYNMDVKVYINGKIGTEICKQEILNSFRFIVGLSLCQILLEIFLLTDGNVNSQHPGFNPAIEVKNLERMVRIFLIATKVQPWLQILRGYCHCRNPA